MSLQNKKLIEELVQAEAQKNSAKMEAVDYKYRFLHTQINPHFIYNSLETINAIAKVNHTPEVSRIVQLIGKYFRNITKYSDHQFIALEKEFELSPGTEKCGDTNYAAAADRGKQLRPRYAGNGRIVYCLPVCKGDQG